MKLRIVVLGVLVAATLLSATGAGAQANGLPSVPSTLAGLSVARESVPKAPKGGRPQLLSTIELFGLRGADKRLQATLQLGTFRPGHQVGSSTFQRTIAAQVGDSIPARYRIAGQVVYLTRSKQLALAVWFHGSSMGVLSIRSDAKQPKAIIRAVVGLGE